MQIYGYHLKKSAKLWVTFWQNIAKLFGWRDLALKKMSIQLEMKVRKTCNIALLRIDIENLCADFVVFKNVISFAELLV